jgi:hypothetical protein
VQPLGSSQHFMEPEGSLPSLQEQISKIDFFIIIIIIIVMKNLVFWDVNAVWLL